MHADEHPVDSPILFQLPDGDIIEIDGIPYEGWGHEPGKWYTVIQHDEADNEIWRRTWTVPSIGE